MEGGSAYEYAALKGEGRHAVQPPRYGGEQVAVGQVHGFLVGFDRGHGFVVIFHVHRAFIVALDFRRLLQHFHAVTGGVLLGIIRGIAKFGDGGDVSVFAAGAGRRARPVQRFLRLGGYCHELLHDIQRFNQFMK